MKILGICGVIALSFAAGCGGSSGPSAAEKKADAETQAAEKKAAAETRAKVKAQAQYEECKTQLGGLLEAEQTLDSHLSVGMTQADYTSEVGDVRAAYDRVPFSDLSLRCVEDVGQRLEKALNLYAKTATTWNNCITDVNCSDDSIKPQLQGSWAKATTHVEEAKTKLDDLRSPDTLPAGGGGETPPGDDPGEESPPANDSDEALQECLDKPTFKEQRACARRLLPE